MHSRQFEAVAEKLKPAIPKSVRIGADLGWGIVCLAALGGADFATLWPYIRILLLFGVIWLAIGYTLFAQMERRARRNGTIGHF